MLGTLLKWAINAWIATTGKARTYDECPWLEGPMSPEAVIGPEFYRQYAAQAGFRVSTGPDAGLIEDFSVVLQRQDGVTAALNPRIANFYEHTAAYKLEVWSQWYAPFSAFARVLIRSLSAKMDQLNIPLYPLETSRGMSNEVLQLRDAGGTLRYACWLRKSILSGRVVYAGFYSACYIGKRPFVRVVFPLPDGNVTVLLGAYVQPDGSVKLISDGKGIGDAGYYRLRRHKPGSVRVKYIPLKETIHVFEDEEGTLRTDHSFVFLGKKLLHLHYKIMPAGVSKQP